MVTMKNTEIPILISLFPIQVLQLQSNIILGEFVNIS